MITERGLQQLDEVLSRSPLALVALDRQLRVSYWSARAEAIFGYEAGEVLRRAPHEAPFVYRKDLDAVLDVATLAEEPPVGPPVESLVIVRTHVRKDGVPRTVRWTTVDVQDHPRYHLVAFAEDITDTVAAQDALLESEERFRSLFESNPETIMLFSPDGTILAVNAAVSKFGPFPREHIIGMHYSAFLDPEEMPRHEEYLQRALAGETLSYRAKARSYHGEPLELAITTVPVSRGGTIEGVFSILRDETAERSAQREIQLKERQLAESEARLRSLVEHNPDAVLALDLDGTMTECNDAALRVSGLPREAIVGTNYEYFLPHETRPKVRAAFLQAGKGNPSFVTFSIVNAQGRAIEVDGTIIPQYSGDAIVGIYAVFQETTQRRAAERRAEMQQQRMRDLYFIAASGKRADARIVASLEMGTRAFGAAAGAVVDTSSIPPSVLHAYRTPGTAPVADETLVGAALSSEGFSTVVEVGGIPSGVLVFTGPAREPRDYTKTDADLLGLISVLIGGAMEAERSRAQLRTLAYYDVLTGLPNRTYLSEQVRDAIEVAQSRLSGAALLYIDLDGFKDVNDILGHTIGDQLLQLVARRLAETIGPRDTLARMGGDEFLVLLPDCQERSVAAEAAERIVRAMVEPFRFDQYEQFLTASVGIALYPDDGREDQTLIKNADIAMSRAKERGRNGYFFYDPTLEAPIHMRLSQEKLLRRALELSEFLVFYQPQLDLRTGQIVSVEALVRWNHPKSGLIEPSQFIPSAEMSGLIVPLGQWVLETAAREVHAWQGSIGRLRLAVNLSARQFHDRQLRARIIAALREAQFAPERFEVEITESVAMADAAQTADIVRDLSDSGIRVALDDFGTGYSSLAYLRSFELDVLKIDRSFVAGIGRSASDETIVNTVIAMAHTLGLQVVAEGVETREQLDFLRANGCDVAQGFAIAPALPPLEFTAFMSGLREKAGAWG